MAGRVRQQRVCFRTDFWAVTVRDDCMYSLSSGSIVQVYNWQRVVNELEREPHG